MAFTKMYFLFKTREYQKLEDGVLKFIKDFEFPYYFRRLLAAVPTVEAKVQFNNNRIEYSAAEAAPPPPPGGNATINWNDVDDCNLIITDDGAGVVNVSALNAGSFNAGAGSLIAVHVGNPGGAQIELSIYNETDGVNVFYDMSVGGNIDTTFVAADGKTYHITSNRII
jgi:hypothetical protein